jgi:hypothetical protein
MDRKALQKWEQKQREKAIAEIKKRCKARGVNHRLRRKQSSQ